MKIRELETSFKELNRISNSEFLKLGRSEKDIILHWTKVEELDCYILNIFAPINHIFFYFSNFEAASDPLHDYSDNLVNGGVFCMDTPKTEKLINSIIKSVKSKKKSVFAEIMLHGLTTFYGYLYLLKTKDINYHSTQLLMGRYIPHVVPINKRNAVSNYYQTQLKQFGDNCTMKFAETNKIWGINNFTGLKYLDMLEAEILRMTETEINKIVEQIVTIGCSGGQWAYDLGAQKHYMASSMGISPIRVETDNSLDKFMLIAKFRIEYAIETSALLLLERTKSSLNNKVLWPKEYDKCICTLISMLDKELNKYPVIKENPMQ